MKRNLERIFATAATILAMILIIILLVIAYGGIKVDDLDNDLVKGLFITLAIIFAVLAITSLVFLFVNDDAIKEITLRSTTAEKTKVSILAIRKMVKSTCNQIEGVKCKGIKLYVSEYGVKLKVTASVKEKDVEQTELYIRNLITDLFKNALGFEFSAIEIAITQFVPAYKPNVAEILAESDMELTSKKEEITEEKEEEVILTEESPADEPIQPTDVIDEVVEETTEDIADSEIETEDKFEEE